MTRICSICGESQVMGSDVAFHMLPKNKATREKWIDAIKSAQGNSWKEKRIAYICSNHFDLSSYKDAHSVTFPHSSCHMRLKPDAVPVLCPKMETHSENDEHSATTDNVQVKLVNGNNTSRSPCLDVKQESLSFDNDDEESTENSEWEEDPVLNIANSKVREILELQEQCKKVERGEIKFADIEMESDVNDRLDQLDIENELVGRVIRVSESAAHEFSELQKEAIKLEQEAIKFKCDCREVSCAGMDCSSVQTDSDDEEICTKINQRLSLFIKNINEEDAKNPVTMANYCRVAKSYITDLEIENKNLRKQNSDLRKQNDDLERIVLELSARK